MMVLAAALAAAVAQAGACGADPRPPGADVDPEVLAVALANSGCVPVATGAGYLVASGVVLTAAHVVAGSTEVEVTTSSGQTVAGRVVAFDPDIDAALVAVPELVAPEARFTRFEAGTTGTVAGSGEPFDVTRRVVARLTDIYRDHPVEKQSLEIDAALERGDSGAALVDEQGRIGGMVFAISRDQPGTAWALEQSEIEPLLAGPLTEAADTSTCVREPG